MLDITAPLAPGKINLFRSFWLHGPLQRQKRMRDEMEE